MFSWRSSLQNLSMINNVPLFITLPLYFLPVLTTGARWRTDYKIKVLNNLWLFERSLLKHTPHAPSRLCAFVLFAPSCLQALRAFMPSCLWHLRALRPFVSSRLKCSIYAPYLLTLHTLFARFKTFLGWICSLSKFFNFPCTVKGTRNIET